MSVIQQSSVPGGLSYAEVGKNGLALFGQTMFGPPVVGRSQNYIGNSYWGSDGKFHGDIAEILLYNRALTSQEQATVRQYIAGKYGISIQ